MEITEILQIIIVILITLLIYVNSRPEKEPEEMPEETFEKFPYKVTKPEEISALLTILENDDSIDAVSFSRKYIYLIRTSELSVSEKMKLV